MFPIEFPDDCEDNLKHLMMYKDSIHSKKNSSLGNTAMMGMLGIGMLLGK